MQCIDDRLMLLAAEANPLRLAARVMHFEFFTRGGGAAAGCLPIVHRRRLVRHRLERPRRGGAIGAPDCWLGADRPSPVRTWGAGNTNWRDRGARCPST